MLISIENYEKKNPNKYIVGPKKICMARKKPVKKIQEIYCEDRANDSTHLVQFNRLNPLQSVLRIFGSEVPDTVVDTDVKTALVKFMRLKRERRGEDS